MAKTTRKRKPLKLKMDEHGRVPFSFADMMHPDFDKVACEALGLDLEKLLEDAIKKPQPRKKYTGKEFDGVPFGARVKF